MSTVLCKKCLKIVPLARFGLGIAKKDGSKSLLQPCKDCKNTKRRESRANHPEREAYHAMLARCLNPHHSNFYRYGGRGISVCKRWQGSSGLISFLLDMGKKPSKHLSLDRIDNNLGYCPDNCRWACGVIQSNNKRSNIVWDHTKPDRSHYASYDKYRVAYNRAYRKLSSTKFRMHQYYLNHK